MPRIKILSIPNHQAGGPYLQGIEMQKGGVSLRGKKFQPGGFTPSGSLIDQNQWAIGDGSATPAVPVTGNYYKTDPSQQTPYGAIVPGSGMQNRTRQVNSFGTPNVKNLSMLLPLNAGLGMLSQANQYGQDQAYRRNNMNNPLSILGRDDSRPDEVKYGYGTFQGGGETIPFAGRRLKLWQQGGIPTKLNGTTGMNRTSNISGRDDMYLVDDINYTLTHPKDPKLTRAINPEDNQLLMDAYLFARRPDMTGKSPDDVISSYFQRPSQQDSLGARRARLGMMGHGALGLYNDTPDTTVRDPAIRSADTQGIVSKLQAGGNFGAMHKLRPYMLRQGQFQSGGSLLDQWDLEDAQDQQDQQQPTIPQQSQPEEDMDLHKKTDLSNEDEYNSALQIATQSNSEGYTPYRSRFEDTDFSGAQGIPQDNPYTTSNPVSLSGNKNAYNYLISKGVSPIAASGIIGNLVQESDLKPTAKDGTGAYGAAQWMGSRLSGLHQFAASNQRSPADLQTQLDYLVKEAQERGDLQKLQNANSPEEAALLFGRSYERPAERTANWARRQREARNVYQP